MSQIDKIVKSAAASRASDVHISCGLPIRFRIDGRLVDASKAPLSEDDCVALAKLVAGDRYSDFKKVGELDMADTYGDGTRCRVNIYRSKDVPSIAIRLLSETIPDLDQLGLPPAMLAFPEYEKGIVIITGETGSGKSTTLAAILDRINHTRPEHIITLEDPIEYIYNADRCSIDQREIGRDTMSYSAGLRASLREDPDIILVGEMRDLDTIETALTAAETGHLVFATLHTKSAADSIDRMVDVFGEGRQRQIRLQLSQTLKAVVSQQLLLRAEGKGRVVACEVMIVNAAIRNLMREGKTPQIENSLATSAIEGSITMDNALAAMVRSQVISPDTALSAARDMEYLEKILYER